jgi:hypothetical protein
MTKGSCIYLITGYGRLHFNLPAFYIYLFFNPVLQQVRQARSCYTTSPLFSFTACVLDLNHLSEI